MTDDAFESVLVPVLRDLQRFLGDMVVIGGWVPELHRRFGEEGEWGVRPLGTTEVDILMAPPESSQHAPRTLAEAMVEAGFSPVGNEDVSAVWERDTLVGERVEFFLDHAGPWDSHATVRALEPDIPLGGIFLSALAVLREHSVCLHVLLGEVEGDGPVSVRVPELGAFLIHKGATFRRRSDPARRVKDLHYIVDVMQSGDARVQAVETQIAGYCAAAGLAAELARQARNQLGAVVGERSGSAIRRGLAQGLSVRHGITQEEGDARAIGYLTDLRELIPDGCGDRSI